MIKKIKIFARLVRLEQWYKNIIIFAPFLFTDKNNLYSFDKIILVFFGFCAISSITYISNDWLDKEKDRLHPIKKNRPLASGEITGRQALLVSVVLGLFIILAAFIVGKFYAVIIFVYFIFTTLYSLGLKNIPLLDILMIAGNFLLRMSAGFKELPSFSNFIYFILLFSIIVIFLTHKRRSDIKMLGKDAIGHKPVLKFYTKKNNYFFRALGYFLTILSFYLLWLNGFLLIKAIGFYLLLVITSVIFSDNPEYTTKPKMLLKSKTWLLVATINLLLMILKL